MAQLDSKNRDFYNSLTDEERKKFSTFLMIRWGSAVDGPPDLQEYYVKSCNHYINKHFFAMSRHPKLQWLMATAVSPGTGNHNHPWIRPKPKEKGNNEVKKYLMSQYPAMKMSDIELMSKLVDSKDIKQHQRDQGHAE